MKLLLALTLVFAFSTVARADQTFMGYSCETVRAYLATHTRAQAIAKAAELHLPKWIIKKAEECK